MFLLAIMAAINCFLSFILLMVHLRMIHAVLD